MEYCLLDGSVGILVTVLMWGGNYCMD